MNVLELVFESPSACPLLRASIRASTKGPQGGFGPRDPVRDRLTPDGIAALYRAPEYPSREDLAADAGLTALLQRLLPEGASLAPVLAAVYMRRATPPSSLLEASEGGEDQVYAAVLKRVLDDAGIVRIPLFSGTPPGWVNDGANIGSCYRITGPLLEISNIDEYLHIPYYIGAVRHLVMYGEMDFKEGLLERMPSLETIVVFDARTDHNVHSLYRLKSLGQAYLPRLRTFVFDTADLDPWYLDINLVTCPRKLARMIYSALQHQVNPFRILNTPPQYVNGDMRSADRDEGLVVLVRHVVNHTEESFRALHENDEILSDDEDYMEEYVPYPGRITLLP